MYVDGSFSCLDISLKKKKAALNGNSGSKLRMPLFIFIALRTLKGC